MSVLVKFAPGSMEVSRKSTEPETESPSCNPMLLQVVVFGLSVMQTPVHWKVMSAADEAEGNAVKERIASIITAMRKVTLP